MNNKIFIPGWEIKYNLSMFNHFRVKIQSNYNIEIYKHYLENGDFISDEPFGIYFKGKEINLFSLNEPKIIIISDFPAHLTKIITNDWNGEGLDIFASVNLNIVLSKHGYSRPIEYKTVSGKTRGELSSKVPIDIQKKEINGIEVELSLHKSEKFEVHQIDLDRVLIFYYPKYKITDNRLGFKFQELIGSLLEEEWTQLYRTPDMIINRFNQVNEILKDDHSLFGVRKELDKYFCNKIKRPTLLFPDDSVYDLSKSEDLSFQQIIKLKSVSITYNDKICVLIDKTNIIENFHDIITRFMSFLLDSKDFKDSVYEFTSIDDEIKQIKEFILINNITAGFLILDNLSDGSDFIYEFIKSNIDIPIKVVKIETILHETWEETARLIWMSLICRLRKSLFQVIKDQNNDDLSLIAISLLPQIRGEFLYLTASHIKNNNKIEYISKLLYNRDPDNETLNMTEFESLWNELIDKDNTNTKKLVLINDYTLLPIILQFKQNKDFDIVLVKESSSVMLLDNENSFEIPFDGCFTKINANEYLLMTNGKPDADFSGLPKPIIVKIFSPSKINDDEILKTIYYRTFIHPASFTKSKLPFELYLSTTYPSSLVYNELLENRISRSLPL